MKENQRECQQHHFKQLNSGADPLRCGVRSKIERQMRKSIRTTFLPFFHRKKLPKITVFPSNVVFIKMLCLLQSLQNLDHLCIRILFPFILCFLLSFRSLECLWHFQTFDTLPSDYCTVETTAETKELDRESETSRECYSRNFLFTLRLMIALFPERGSIDSVNIENREMHTTRVHDIASLWRRMPHLVTPSVS